MTSTGKPLTYSVYSDSINKCGEGSVLMACVNGKDALITDLDMGFVGELFPVEGRNRLKADLNHENACVLRSLFPFTAPVQVLKNKSTMGVGDRLGIATPGHIRVFKKYKDIVPVFAQQSMRELKQTNRSLDNVLDSVTFSVFKYGFKSGFGADGDHLKTIEEVEYAISCGYSMITLDLSNHIRNDANSMTSDQLNVVYDLDEEIESLYIENSFDINGVTSLKFNNKTEFRRIVVTFNKAIEFVEEIYNRFLKRGEINVDLEISIDEVEFPTTPLQHFYIANELNRRNVCVSSIAPRFCGQFQKGIDYIGDIPEFERGFQIHTAIADYFNYKISIHSGSDKFSLFPAIGRISRGVFHIKTSGTSWIEAMRVIAIKAPALYRMVHKYALEVFEDARTNYVVTTDLAKIPDIDDMTDDELPLLFTQDHARQLIHLTYGHILTGKDAQENFIFRNKLYKVWERNMDTYSELLEKHIGNHIKSLQNI